MALCTLTRSAGEGTSPMSMDPSLAQLHHQIVRGLVETGSCPTNEMLAHSLRMPREEVESRLRLLADIHGVVLHPYASVPWIVHPFSLVPTLNWVQGQGRGWWAPCIWCALGISVVVGGRTEVHTRLGAEAEPIRISVKDGVPSSQRDAVVHFAIPPAAAWRNVHEHCSLVLPFRSESEIDDWCSRHSLPRGEAVPLPQVADLARKWYGQHAAPDWHKWTVAEAAQIFHSVGLRSAFWNLGDENREF